MNDKEIAHDIHMLCSRIPGANFYTAAEMALEKARALHSAEADVPEDVMWALDRMCTPLDKSRLSGATAETDALCMRMIRHYVLSVPRSGEVAMEAKPVAHSVADIRRAALEEAYEAAMSCDGALNNAGAVAMKLRALIAATPASSAGLFGWVSKRDFDLHSGFVGRKVLDDDVPLYAAPASSVADAAEAYGKGYSAGKAFEQRHAAGASERADAEKDAAMTDEELQQIAFKHCYATTASDGFIFLKDADRGLREFARAILAANKEKK